MRRASLHTRLERLEQRIIPATEEPHVIQVIFGTGEATEANSFLVEINRTVTPNRGKFRNLSGRHARNSVR